MDGKALIAGKLFTVAANLVSAAGTTADAKYDSEEASKIGLAGDVSAALGEQFVTATEYVIENEGKPTIDGLDDYLRNKKMSISWALISSGLKAYKQQAKFEGASKCIAETTQSATATVEFALSVGETEATGGLAFALAASKGVALMSQLYATKVACGNAMAEGFSDLSEMTKSEIAAFTQVAGRISSVVNCFVEDMLNIAADSLNPVNYDLSPYPKPVIDELQAGLFFTLRLCSTAKPIDGLKTALTTKVSQEDARHSANAVVIANSRVANLDALSALSISEASNLAKTYTTMSYANVWADIRDQLRIN